MRIAKKNIKHIYLIIIFIGLILLLLKILDNSVLKLHNKLEGFSSNSPEISQNNEHAFVNLKNNTNTNTNTNKNTNLSPSDISNNNSSPEVSNEENTSINTPAENTNTPEESGNSNENNNKANLNNNVLEKINDMEHLNELENKDLEIEDFYPSRLLASQKNKDEILKFALTMDLFHQIIPKFKTGFLGIIWFDKRIVGIYETQDLVTKKWNLLDNSIPLGMDRPVFISYDTDRKLIGIFEETKDSIYNSSRYSLYKKESLDINSNWKFIEKTNIVSLIYDEDDILIGLDNKGRFYKKSNKLIESQWNLMDLNFEHIPMRKLMYDYNSNMMFGLGTDFRIYKKKNSDWKNSEWDTTYGPSKKSLSGSIRDMFYDYDGHIVGLSRIGLVKKKEEYYLSDNELYREKVEDEEKNLSIFKLLYAITGIKVIATYSNNTNINSLNNVYIDGKKISEYSFKDSRLNEFLKFRMNLKKKCRKIKGMRIKQEEENKVETEEIRNERFNRILNQQKDTIDGLVETIQTLRDNSFSNKIN